MVRKVLHKKWTLQQTLAEMQVLEDTAIQAKAMGQQETNCLSTVSRRKKEKKKVSQCERTKEGIRTCKYCGGTHPLQKELSPAYGKFCSKCGKSNHFSEVCLSARGPKGRFKGKTSLDDHTSPKRDVKRTMTDSEKEDSNSDEDQGTDFIKESLRHLTIGKNKRQQGKWLWKDRTYCSKRRRGSHGIWQWSGR